MTLLITAATSNFCVASSDTRITTLIGRRYVPVDEQFNKHIFFSIQGLKANVTYTGLARWHKAGREIRMYDIITECLSRCAIEKKQFTPITLELMSDISRAIRAANVIGPVELHVVGYYDEVPYPLMACISSFTDQKPWAEEGKFEWHYEIDDYHLFIRFAETSAYMVGGVSSALTMTEHAVLSKVIKSGANGFDVSNLSAKLIQRASRRSSAVGNRSVATILPSIGFLDTNLWDKTVQGIIGYMPKMIFENGTAWGPSEFPVDLDLIARGYIPTDNIFFRSLVYRTAKRSIRRRIFKFKKGNKVPGLMGLIGLALYGQVPDGYDDLGLSHGDTDHEDNEGSVLK